MNAISCAGPRLGTNSYVGSAAPPSNFGSVLGKFRFTYPPLTKPPMRTIDPSASGSAAEYHRLFCIDSTAGLSNHWQRESAKLSEVVHGLSIRIDLAPSKS